MGTFGNAKSPAKVFSPIIGAELFADGDGPTELPLDPSFEHALLLVEGTGWFEKTALSPNSLYYLGVGRDVIGLSLSAGARLLLIGGTPFGEQILMWWNFVARTQAEIAEARRRWETEGYFGIVKNYNGSRILAPPLKVRL